MIPLKKACESRMDPHSGQRSPGERCPNSLPLASTVLNWKEVGGYVGASATKLFLTGWARKALGRIGSTPAPPGRLDHPHTGLGHCAHPSLEIPGFSVAPPNKGLELR